MKIILFIIALIISNNSFAQSFADLRGQSFYKSSTCNIINAKEILQLSTIPFNEKKVPEIRSLILDTKTARINCYEQAEEMIYDLLNEEQSINNDESTKFILKLQYESDISFKALLKLRKEISIKLLSSILEDIETSFNKETEETRFYIESDKTKYLMNLETTLAIESERRQVFVTDQFFKPTNNQKVTSLLQKAHYQFSKTLLLFEEWPNDENKNIFFKQFNAELRYGVSILSQILPIKDALSKEKYKVFRDMLQKAVRLNLRISQEENQTTAQQTEIYAEISKFTATIRSLLK